MDPNDFKIKLSSYDSVSEYLKISLHNIFSDSNRNKAAHGPGNNTAI
jgi:hypothetical protein